MKNIKQIEEYIRSKCIEANPSILDFQVGCNVEWIDRVWTIADCCIKGQWMLTSKIFNSVIVEPEKLKSIGRPIELSDILFSLEDRAWAKETLELLAMYNLSLPFLDQTDETKIFIAKMLNYNE